MIMGTRAKSIQKGQKFWSLHPKLGRPMLGTVVCLTTEPGKMVGLEFEEPLPPGLSHLDLDGRAKKGYSMWAHPEHILTEKEYEGACEAQAAAKARAASIKEVDELVL